MDTFIDLEESFLTGLATIHEAASTGKIENGKSMAKKCASLLQSMKLEARTMSGKDLEMVNAKVVEHVKALSDANFALEKATSNELFGTSNSSSTTTGSKPLTMGHDSLAARERADAATKKLSTGTMKLLDAQKTLEETVGTAEGSVSALQSQRETMMRIQSKASQTSALADEAMTITKRMQSWSRAFGFS